MSAIDDPADEEAPGAGRRRTPRPLSVELPPRVALLYASVEGFLNLPLVGRYFVLPVRGAVAEGRDAA